jgi:hypothetical protein
MIVGGHAVMLYTEPRYTKDLEIWIEPTEENATRVFHALMAFGSSCPSTASILQKLGPAGRSLCWAPRKRGLSVAKI